MSILELAGFPEVSDTPPTYKLNVGGVRVVVELPFIVDEVGYVTVSLAVVSSINVFTSGAAGLTIK
jgi:hypothetical protein